MDPGRSDARRRTGLRNVAVHHAPQVDRFQQEAFPGSRGCLDHGTYGLGVLREGGCDLSIEPPLVGLPLAFLRPGVRRRRLEQGLPPRKICPQLVHGHWPVPGSPFRPRACGLEHVDLPHDAGDPLEHLPVLVHLFAA